MVQRYFLREYGSWGVATLAFAAGLAVSRGATISSAVFFLAIAFFINSKQALTTGIRGKGAGTRSAFSIFALQMMLASLLVLIQAGQDILKLLPLAFVPLAYLLLLRLLGEHALLTEIAGFVLLSLSALLARYSVDGVIDLRLYTAVAVFFSAGVFKVRLQFKQRRREQMLLVGYTLCAFMSYGMLELRIIPLLPLLDNLAYGVFRYRVRLSTTGWTEVVKGIVFVILLALTYPR